MEVKILCPCGTKFAFEVEPVDGQMPEPVQCPTCGADRTAAANGIIQQALAGAASAPAAKPALVRIGAAPLPSPAPPGPPADQTAEETVQAVTRCSKHPLEVAAAECTVCGKPICQLCLEQFGFLCSVYCQEQAETRKLVLPSFSGQKIHARARERHQQNRFMLVVGLAVVAVIAVWAWYGLYASQPRLAYRLEASRSQPFVHAQWLGRDQLLVATGAKIALHEAGSGQVLWTVTFKPEERLVSPSAGDPIRVTGDTFWAVQTGRAAQFDLKSGQRKRDVALPADISQVLWSQGALMVASSPPHGPLTLTRLDLQSGQTQTETVRATPSAPAFAVAPPRVLDDDDKDFVAPTFRERPEFVASGGGAVRLISRLLQARMVEASDMNRPDAFSGLDKETLRASDSTPAVKTFLRGSTKLRVHDFSRYAVTLRRFFVGASEWTGEVIGRPAFFSLATVDVLVSGTNVAVFSRSSQKLWEAKLSHPVSPDILRDPDEFPDGPCRESGNRLYVFDLGVLTAFDLKTGQAQWRLPAVGIEQVQPDVAGLLYVAATTAGPEAIALDEPAMAQPDVQPLLIKVDAASGKVLWQRDRVAQRCVPSDKFLYVTRRQAPGRDLISLATNDETVHFRVRRLKPGNGEEVWAYYQPRPPQRMEASGSRFLLQYPDEIQVVKFLSL
jgi:hypothetical protein